MCICVYVCVLYRKAPLVYHDNGACYHFIGKSILCMVVVEEILEGRWKDSRFLYLVHNSPNIIIPSPLHALQVKYDETEKTTKYEQEYDDGYETEYYEYDIYDDEDEHEEEEEEEDDVSIHLRNLSMYDLKL